MTVGHGIDLAKPAGKRVYVCAGTFPEALVVGAPRDGVAVYGGFDCGTWAYSVTQRVAIAPPQTGYALELDGLVRGATFTDIEFDAQRANLADPGESSIAVFVSGSQNVIFQRVVMVAANATDGAAGASAQAHLDGGSGATNWYGTPPAYAELNGNNATSAGAGAERACTCADITSSVGGAGGAGPSDGGSPPGPGLPSYTNDAGAGFAATNGLLCGGGGSPVRNGSDAPVGSDASAKSSLGAVASTGWTPASGADGSSGQPGQGGGGGGDGPAASGGGGSGACGGCGGAGGKGGTGGGSSMALFSFQSAVALTDCTLTASNAGRGGAGGNGEAGQPGSLVGGNGNASGCQGGGGGSGTGGNGGQGGPGGLSLGIGYSGIAPLFDGSAVAPGQNLARVVMGAAGAAGTPGLAGVPATTSVGQPQAGTAGPLGAPGVAQAVLNL
jgi:hypothetical protein